MVLLVVVNEANTRRGLLNVSCWLPRHDSCRPLHCILGPLAWQLSSLVPIVVFHAGSLARHLFQHVPDLFHDFCEYGALDVDGVAQVLQ